MDIPWYNDIPKFSVAKSLDISFCHGFKWSNPFKSQAFISCHGFNMGNQSQVFWLVVSTPLKNICQLGWWFPIYGKKTVPNHQPASKWGSKSQVLPKRQVVETFTRRPSLRPTRQMGPGAASSTSWCPASVTTWSAVPQSSNTGTCHGSWHLWCGAWC